MNKTYIRCKLCKTEIKGIRMICCNGSLCEDCVRNISDAEYQPATSLTAILWCLAECYYRIGKGEKGITFEQVWNGNEAVKMVKSEGLEVKGGRGENK